MCVKILKMLNLLHFCSFLPCLWPGGPFLWPKSGVFYLIFWITLWNYDFRQNLLILGYFITYDGQRINKKHIFFRIFLHFIAILAHFDNFWLNFGWFLCYLAKFGCLIFFCSIFIHVWLIIPLIIFNRCPFWLI